MEKPHPPRLGFPEAKRGVARTGVGDKEALSLTIPQHGPGALKTSLTVGQSLYAEIGGST